MIARRTPPLTHAPTASTSWMWQSWRITKLALLAQKPTLFASWSSQRVTMQRSQPGQSLIAFVPQPWILQRSIKTSVQEVQPPRLEPAELIMTASSFPPSISRPTSWLPAAFAWKKTASPAVPGATRCGFSFG